MTKKKSWISTSNIYIYLFDKVLLAFVLLLLSQAFFYLDNTRIFHLDGIGEWLGVLWGNIIFGIATLGLLLLPYCFANLLPFAFRWNKHYHRTVEVLFYYLPVLFMLISNICDAAYYQYTYRRLSGEIFRYLGISGNMTALWPHFVIDYWQATLFAAAIIIVLFWASRRICLSARDKYRKHMLNDIVGLIIGSLCVIFLFRGGFGKSIEWHDTTKYCQAKNCALVTNSGYNIIRTLNGGTLQEVNYMDDSQASKLFNPEMNPEPYFEGRIVEAWNGWEAGCGSYYTSDSSNTTSLSNIVIIVLESFSQEYMGCYNNGIMPSFTPFLDSLAQHCVVYQGRANGKKSIEGIPAIFGSLPTLMTFPLTMSDYADDSLYALPAILRDHGYHTAFFHGSYNGVMSFDQLCQQLGFDEYYGQNEYMADRLSKESDYDGCWGIYDEHFLQYFSRRLGTFHEPFMAGVFTISSHHPYTMQPEHKDDFEKGPHPLCRVVSYTDNALRKFFDSARKTKWYSNTTFIITADHSGQGLHREYNDYNGWYRIPMLIYRPLYEESLVPEHGPAWSCHKVSPRIMQQTDIMPTIIDYLGIQTHAVCFGTSVFRNPTEGWQIAFGNGYYQLETQNGVAVLGQEKEEIIGNSSTDMLKAIIQQYNHRLIHNELRPNVSNRPCAEGKPPTAPTTPRQEHARSEETTTK